MAGDVRGCRRRCFHLCRRFEVSTSLYRGAVELHLDRLMRSIGTLVVELPKLRTGLVRSRHVPCVVHDILANTGVLSANSALSLRGAGCRSVRACRRMRGCGSGHRGPARGPAGTTLRDRDFAADVLAAYAVFWLFGRSLWGLAAGVMLLDIGFRAHRSRTRHGYSG